jgi:hypothetical protein
MISPTREPFGHHIPSGSFGRSHYSGAPFAIGLGIVLGAKSHLPGVKGERGGVEYSVVWWIFFAGMVAPTVIYLIRAGLMFLAGKFAWTLPPFALLLPGESSWHIAKMGYIFFCLPSLAVACGQLVLLVNQQFGIPPIR